MSKESSFQKKLIRFLENEMGAYVIKYNASGLGKTGVPDVIFCYDGKFCAIECKRTKGILSLIQQYNLEEIRDRGGLALCLREDQMKDFSIAFRTEDWGKLEELSLENEKEIKENIS